MSSIQLQIAQQEYRNKGVTQQKSILLFHTEEQLDRGTESKLGPEYP